MTADNDTILIVVMAFGLLALMFVVYRYFTTPHTKWNDLLDIYILCTLGVPASRQLGIRGGGIVVHNFAELWLLGHLWFGTPHDKGAVLWMWTINYAWAICVIVALVPPTAQFFTLSTQCLFCDWMLVATFVFMARRGAKYRKNMGCIRHLGICAATLHLLSTEPLLFGIAMSNHFLEAIAIAFLLPSFILYSWISVLEQRSRRLAISLDLPYNTLQEGESISIELTPRRAATKATNAKHKVDVASDEHTTMTKITHDDVIDIGLLNLDGKNRKSAAIIAFFGFAVAFLNACIVYLSPCFVNIEHTLSWE